MENQISIREAATEADAAGFCGSLAAISSGIFSPARRTKTGHTFSATNTGPRSPILAKHRARRLKSGKFRQLAVS